MDALKNLDPVAYVRFASVYRNFREEKDFVTFVDRIDVYKKDKYFVGLANTLARNSLGYTGPNPSVGAIVVKNDAVISHGSTSHSGRPHAEINALNKLSNKQKKNSSIYISLEPCAHQGKTPPCVNKIIKSKPSKVVYSINDIDLRTSGKSYKILKSKKLK